MFSINGIIFTGNNNIIANGRVISEGRTGKVQNFDERKFEDASSVEKITIDSAVADVNISVSNSSKIEVHFYGRADIDGDIDFDVRMVKHELIIALKFICNCYNGSLKLDVTVPRKIFKTIAAKSSSADITLGEGVSMEYLKVKTQSGNLETNVIFTNASITTMSGNVELYIDATKDINVDISTMSGNVSAEFNNISDIGLSTRTMSGNVRDYHKGGTGYNANVDISTMSGNIRIR